MAHQVHVYLLIFSRGLQIETTKIRPDHTLEHFTPCTMSEAPGSHKEAVSKAPSPEPETMGDFKPSLDHDVIQDPPTAKRSAPRESSRQPHAGKKVKRELTKYREEVEDFSDIGVYTPRYDEAVACFGKVREMLLSAYEEFQKAGYSTNEAEKISRAVFEITVDSKCMRRRQSVAVIGGMGFGKSSLIGSLTNFPPLAVVMSDGASGTQVVQEFIAIPPNQPDMSAFEAEIIPLPQTKIDSLIQSNLLRFFKANHYLNSEEVHEFDANEESRFNDMLGNSTKFFAAVLLSYGEFDTEEQVQDWLIRQAPEDKRASEDMKPLHANISALVTKYLKKLQKMKFAASEPGDLSNQLQSFYRLQRDDSGNLLPSPCYLIAKILIKAYGSILLGSGISCADVPGSDDVDQNRTDAVSAYLKEDCDVRIIIHPANRIEDNSQFLALLHQHAHEARVVIVATKIDQLNVQQCRKRFTPAETAELDRMENELRLLEDEFYRTQEASLLPPQNMILQEKCIQDKRHVLDFQQKVRDTGVRFACEIIKKVLRKIVGTRMKGKYIEILFTDSVTYQKHLAGVDPDSPPSLSVAATGIPALRRFLVAMPANIQRTNFDMTCRHNLPRLIEKAKLACEKDILIRKQEVETLVTKRRDNCIRLIDEAERSISDILKTYGADATKARITAWKREGASIIEKWEKIPATSHRAFCRHHGKWHKKKSEPMTSWNGEVLRLISPGVNEIFKGLTKEIR